MIPLSSVETRDLLEIVEVRHKRASTIEPSGTWALVAHFH